MPKTGATNPFRFGALALDDAFTDRDEEIAELGADMRNGQDVVVFAPRRYGKSSLVWRVAQRAVTQRVLVAQVDLMRAPTKERLAEKLAAAIHDDLATPLMRAKDRLRVFSDLRVAPIVTVDPQTASLSFSFDAYAARHGIDATLEDLLALPGRLASERKRRVGGRGLPRRHRRHRQPPHPPRAGPAGLHDSEANAPPRCPTPELEREVRSSGTASALEGRLVSAVAPIEVRAFILEHVADSLAAKGVDPAAVPDDFDLLLEGVIDSFGLIELIGALEGRFEVTLDFEQLDPDTVTILGSLADYVSNQAAPSP